MAEINVMGEPGFQEIVIEQVDEETEKPHISEKPMKKKETKYPVQEILAAVLSFGLVVVFAWYFYMKSHIKADVEELTPGQYRNTVTDSDDNVLYYFNITFNLIT